MLFSYYIASKPFGKNVVVNGILYKKSRKLRKIEFYLINLKFFITLLLPTLAYVLYKMNVQILNISPGMLIWIGLLLGQIIMLPVTVLFLPKPIQNHLTKVETET